MPYRHSFASWPTENLIFYRWASKASIPHICINMTNMRYSSKRELTLIAALKFYFTWSKPLISDWHGCVSQTSSAKYLPRKIHPNISSEHLIFWPGWLCHPNIFSQAPNIHPSPPHPPLNQGHRCAMAKVNCIGYDIYTHVDFLWIQSINLKILKEHCSQQSHYVLKKDVSGYHL